jgi:hypothetical protein
MTNLKSFDEFKEYIRNKSICIVGAAIILDCNAGKEIDEHDIIIRINNYENLLIKPEYYGTKTNIVCYNFFQHDINLNKNNKIEWIFNTHNLIHKNINNTKHFNSSKLKYPNINFSLFPEKKDYDLKVFPTSGFCVVMEFIRLLDIIKKLSLYGISFNITKYNDIYLKNFKNKNKFYKDKIDHHDFALEREKIKEHVKDIVKNEKLYINDKLLLDYIKK